MRGWLQAVTGEGIPAVLASRLLALLVASWVSPAVAADRPNIVLIVADDMGYSDFGAFGGEIDTPHIDALAAEGVRFSNFHTASSCAPTRAMLLTGVDHHLAGVGNLRETVPLSQRGEPGYLGVLNDRVTTVATHLRASGYRTAVAGKWHLGHEPGNLPPARGFDYSVIQADSGSDNFAMRPYLPMTPEARWYENGERISSLPDGFYSSTFFVDRTLAFLEASGAGDRPFFAYLAFQANHTPLQAPARFIDAYRGRYTQGWARVHERRIGRLVELGLLDKGAAYAEGPAQAAWDALPDEQQYYEARRMQAYAGMATAMDHEVGRLVAYLRAAGEYDNTVFIVLSDNGASVAEPYESAFGRWWLERNYHHDVESLGEEGSWVAAGRGWGAVSNAPLSGHKFSAREGGVRVPLIVSGPDSFSPGAIYRHFVYVTDIAPTLLDIAGLDVAQVSASAAALSGTSLLSAVGDPARPLHDAGAAVGYEFAGTAALYSDGFKLVKDRLPVGDGQWRLYDLDADPGETTDLSGERPVMFRAMREDYAAYADRVGVLSVPEDYVLQKQAMINALLFVYAPRYLPAFVAAVGLIALVLAGTRFRRYRAGKA